MPEQNEEKFHVKYADSIAKYKATLYRSAFAIREELEPGLKQFVQNSGAPSLSGMITMLATEPETFAALLKPHFERLQAEEKPTRRRHKVTMKALMDEMRDGDLSPEDVKQALSVLRAKKQGA